MATSRVRLNLVVKVEGDDKAERMLTDLGERAVHAAPAMRGVMKVMLASERALWERGRSWAPLSESTVAAKQAQGFPREPLVRTGDLRRSLVDEEAAGAVREITQYGMKFGSRVWYGIFAQTGTSRGEPKRKIISLRAKDRLAIREIIERYLATGLRR